VPLHDRKPCRDAECREPFFLIVDEGLEGRKVQAAYAGIPVFQDAVENRDHRCFRFASRGRCNNEDIFSGRNFPVSLLLHFPEIAPPEALEEDLLQGAVQGTESGGHNQLKICPGALSVFVSRKPAGSFAPASNHIALNRTGCDNYAGKQMTINRGLFSAPVTTVFFFFFR
jgi:hypothetical protein